MKFFIKYSKKIIKHVLFLFFPHFRNIYEINSYIRTHKIKKLHLGAGLTFLDSWLNTDLKYNKEKGIFALDVKKKFPIADNTFDYIFSEHLIEHLDYKEGIVMLKKCYRILKPGGKIRIATPNLKFLVDLYKIRIPKKYVMEYINSEVQRFYPNVPANCRDVFVINIFFREWGHKFIYDFKTLRAIFKDIGFVSIKKCDVGKSTCPYFQNLERHGKAIELELQGKVMGEKINRLQTFVVEAEKNYIA